MYTVFVCLGGTGTQLGGAICNLYPLLKLSGIAEEPFSMFILDKDTNSGIYKACVSARQRYEDCLPLLPFDALPVYELTSTVYQEMQGATGLLGNAIYTVMNLIGDDEEMGDLASMCWPEEKRNESLRDGNNRDPSRGSLDALVCLDHLEESSLYEGKAGKQGLRNLADKYGSDRIRVVILGGATGGMGSSLIVPLAKKLRDSFPGLRIDLILLGPYFEIPQRKAPPPGTADVDNIGTSLDSFYRAADQIHELHDLVDNDWYVYYAAIPGFDDTAGTFEKNGAVKRKSHLLELAAALASLYLGKGDTKPGFYETALSYEKDRSPVTWNEIPFGLEIKKPAEDFLKLISLIATKVLPELSADLKDIKKSAGLLGSGGYLGPYFKKNPADEKETLEAMRDRLKTWLQNARPYYEFWQEIQLGTHLGWKDGKSIVEFFPQGDMNRLGEFIEGSKKARENEDIPLWGGTTWQLFLDNRNPDKKRLTDTRDALGKLRWMFEDIWNIIQHKEGRV